MLNEWATRIDKLGNAVNSIKVIKSVLDCNKTQK